MSVTTVITNGSPSANIRNICGPVNGNNSKYYVGFQGTGQAINRVQLKLANHASAQNNSTSMWQVQIYSSTSQNPGPSTAQVKPNALLYSSNLKSRADVNAITPNSVFFDIDFPSAFTLANGTWYVLVLLCISGTWDYGVNMIYVNCLDTRPANIFGQWTGNAWYDLSSGYYNCIAFQLQYVSSGGGSWNGGTITNPIELKQNFTEVIGELGLQNLLYEEWENKLPDIPSAPVGYTLKDNTSGHGNRIFGVLIKQSSSSAGSPAVGLTHHLFVRGDFQVRGMIDSKEGVFVAHGGPKLVGWGPEGINNPNAKRNPMLLIKNDNRPDNVAPDTWETRIMSSTGAYSWANFETNHLTTKGKVMCDDIVHTNAIGVRTAGATIGFYNSIMPHPNAQTRNSGSSAQYWHNTYGGNVYGKQAYTFGCERSLSGKEWTQLSSRADAEKVLSHEVRKKLYHITYSEENTDEIICVCGKSVKEPCPEHLDAWNDRYARNETKRLEAASFLVLEHSTDLAKLTNALEVANEKIRMLEQKLEKLEAN